MKGPIDDDLKVALRYLNQVNLTLRGGGDGGKKYRTFYTFLGEFRDGKISVPDLISSVKELLSGHDDLLQGFALFLPDKFASNVKATEPKDYTTTTSVNGDGGYVGYDPHPKRLKICEDVPKTVKGFPPKRQRQEFSDDLISQIQQATDLANKGRERFEDGDGVPKDYTTTTSVNGDGDYVGYDRHPKRLKICENVAKTVKGFPPKRQRHKCSDDLISQIQQAIDLANKVRERFEDGDVVYKSFLDALCGYKKGEGKISISQVEKELKQLFCGHPDLLLELSRYTADFYGADQATEYEQRVWESMKKGKRYESYQKPPREEEEEQYRYETMLFKCEEDRCKADVAIRRFESAIEKMELFLQDANKTGSGPITDLKEHFTPLNLKSIEELYEFCNEGEVYNCGLDMIDQLRINPIKAGDIVLIRLKQKLEESKRYRSQAEPVWAEVYKDCHEKLGRK